MTTLAKKTGPVPQPALVAQQHRFYFPAAAEGF
jgi:hypothetical protein